MTRVAEPLERREDSPGGPCPLCGHGEAAPVARVLTRRMVRCRECGLVYRHPRPAATPAAAAAPPGPALLAREQRVGARRSRQFRRFFPEAGPPGRLLDVGCGYGYFLVLAREAGWDTVGVDVDPQAIGYARGQLGVEAVCGELPGLRLPEASFDLVTFWNSLECVADPLALLREARRLTRPGGRVFLRTQNAIWHRVSFAVSERLKPLGLGRALAARPYLTFIFNQTSLSRLTLGLLLRRAGFEPLRIANSRPIPGDPYGDRGALGERLITTVKLGVHGAAQSIAFLSGGRWLIGPSLEAWGQAGRDGGR